MQEIAIQVICDLRLEGRQFISATIGSNFGGIKVERTDEDLARGRLRYIGVSAVCSGRTLTEAHPARNKTAGRVK